MKIKFLIILGVISGIMSVWYFNQESINKEKLFKSYENYLKEEYINSQKKFGLLNKNVKVILKSLKISTCKNINNEKICHIETQIENFRGLENEYLVITIKEENKNYKIIKIKSEVK